MGERKTSHYTQDPTGAPGPSGQVPPAQRGKRPPRGARRRAQEVRRPVEGRTERISGRYPSTDWHWCRQLPDRPGRLAAQLSAAAAHRGGARSEIHLRQRHYAPSRSLTATSASARRRRNWAIWSAVTAATSRPGLAKRFRARWNGGVTARYVTQAFSKSS